MRESRLRYLLQEGSVSVELLDDGQLLVRWYREQCPMYYIGYDLTYAIEWLWWQKSRRQT